tara:strand:+ start:2008 stop:2871 length:864 start_codon:yes stop_codon:yes gene_type:complete
MNLVIGTSGKIGTYYQKFSKLNNNIYASRKNKLRNNFKFDFTKNKFLPFFKKFNFKSVVLFSSISDPIKCKKNKILSKKVNIIYTKKLLNFLISNNIYFIFFSSEYIYPGKKNKIYMEKSNLNSNMIYAHQKIEIENYIKFKKYENCAILRISKTYGDNINDSSMFSNILSLYKKGQKSFIIANDQYFRPLFVKDLVKIIDLFLNKKIQGTYNVCGDEYSSRFNFIKNFFKNKKINDVKIKKCSIKIFDKKIFFPKYLNLSNKKIKKTIKFNFTQIKNGYRKLCINS